MRIEVEYFAILREQRGVKAESISTASATVAVLYDELRARHGFTLPGDRVRGAVNDARAYGERFLATAPPAFFGAELAAVKRLLGR